MKFTFIGSVYLEDGARCVYTLVTGIKNNMKYKQKSSIPDNGSIHVYSRFLNFVFLNFNRFSMSLRIWYGILLLTK